jgi:hypothetical protein
LAHQQALKHWSKIMQKAAFACFPGDSALPVFESSKAKKRKFLFLFKAL